jgi:hypothetical protein
MVDMYCVLHLVYIFPIQRELKRNIGQIVFVLSVYSGVADLCRPSVVLLCTLTALSHIQKNDLTPSTPLPQFPLLDSHTEPFIDHLGPLFDNIGCIWL